MTFSQYTEYWGKSARIWISNFLMGKGYTRHCGWFVGHVWRNEWYIKQPTLLCQFLQYLHNLLVWPWAAGWIPVFWSVTFFIFIAGLFWVRNPLIFNFACVICLLFVLISLNSEYFTSCIIKKLYQCFMGWVAQLIQD